MDRSIRFSIVNDLKGRWAPNHLRSARMNYHAWLRLLLDMGAFWKMEVETILETRFYVPFEKP
jgi:hypothetical protein